MSHKSFNMDLNDENLIEVKRNKQSESSQDQATISNKKGESSKLPILADRIDYFRINPRAFISEAGFYEIKSNNEFVKSLSYNYDRSESLSETYTNKDLLSFIENNQIEAQLYDSNIPEFKEIIASNNNSTGLWKYFIALSVIFVFVEVLIIRFWK